MSVVELTGKTGNMPKLYSLMKEDTLSYQHCDNSQPCFNIQYEVYTGYHGISEIKHSLSAFIINYMLAKAPELPLFKGR